MTIKIDRGSRTYLAVCCCGWRGTTTTLEAVARRQAVTHEKDTHPGDRHARNSARQATQRKRRHAADS